MGCRRSCIEKLRVGLHWVTQDCYFCRRSLDDFATPGYGCLSMGYFVACVEILHGIGLFNSLEVGLTISSHMPLDAICLTKDTNLIHYAR